MKFVCAVVCVLLAGCGPTLPQSRVYYASEAGPSEHSLRIADADGKVLQDVDGLEHIYALRATPAGTVLATLCEDSGAPLGLVEISPCGQRIWGFDWPSGRADIAYFRAANAFPDGTVLVAGLVGSGPGGFESALLLVLDRKGDEIRRVDLGPVRFLGAVRPLEDGGILVAGEEVYELDREGNRRFTLPHQGWCHDALKLPDGHYVLGEMGTQRVVELDPDGEELWHAFHPKPVYLQLLPGGGILTGG